MKLNKEKILNIVKNIPSVANKDKWVFTLDKDEGALFYAPKIIPNNAELRQITDEYAVYFDKAFNPKGLMIEYYGVNFIKHHPEFEVMTEKIFKEKSKNETETVNPRTSKNDEVVVFKALLEKTLISDAVQDNLVPA